MQKRLPLFLLLLLISPTLLAQGDFARNSPGIAFAVDTLPVRPDGHYLRGYWQDAKTIATRPFLWQGRQFVQAGTVLGAATVSYFFFDKRIQQTAQTRRNDFTNAVSTFAGPFGGSRTFWVVPGALFLHGQVFSNAKTTRVGLLALESQLLSGVVVQALKVGLGRKRPYESDSPHDWVGPSLRDFHSFPSGHSQAAFALATVVAMEFRDARAVPPIAYGLASLTALSRINGNDHWLSDIIVGSALGHFIAKTVVRRHPESGRTSPDVSVFVDPMGRPGVVWRF